GLGRPGAGRVLLHASGRELACLLHRRGAVADGSRLSAHREAVRAGPLLLSGDLRPQSDRQSQAPKWFTRRNLTNSGTLLAQVAWTTCPRCGFTQIPWERCLRCERILERQQEAAARAARAPAETVAVSPLPPPPVQAAPVLSRQRIAVAGGILLLLAAAGFVWRSRLARSNEQVEAVPSNGPAQTVLDLAGRWRAHATITLPGSPPRPAVREVFIETDREGQIRAAGVLLTDPRHGGAGAGYRSGADARGLIERFVPALAAERSGAALPVDFVPLPPWIPPRARLWRALEGQPRRGSETRYLLLESVESDYLVQAGINQTGFLSWAFFSPEYAPARGADALSARIHPAPDTSLRGFEGIL